MPTPEDLTQKFWKSLKSDRTVMLGLLDAGDFYARPMTAQAENDHGPIWFFTANDTAMVQNIKNSSRALCNFSSKGHDLFASVIGSLSISNDREIIEKLWNPFVAAWYKGGKDDPKLTLLKFDPESAEIWLNGSSLVAGLKILMGSDPKKDYQDNVARVNMR